MGTPVVVNGVNYTVPAYGDVGWAQGAGSLPALLIALAAVTATTPSFMQLVNVSSATQAVLSGKTYLIASNTTAVQLNLPSPAANAYFMIIDSGGNSLTNNITIHRAAAESINGNAADLVLGANHGSWGFMSNGTNWFSIFGISQGTTVYDDTDGHVYRILTTGGVVSSQLIA